MINRKGIFLGYYNNKDDAIKSRLTAEQKYFGRFAPQRDLFEKYSIVLNETYNDYPIPVVSICKYTTNKLNEV